MRMVRMMIVDDEPLVRALIRECIDWKELGVELVGEAGSGEEALEALKGCTPEIMLLDVCMPGMNGIELARRILEQQPDMHIVIISGHDTFEYAKQCIRLGVKEYLLKPVNEQELERTVRGIVSGLRPEALLGAQSRSAVRDVIDALYRDFRDPELSLQALAERFHLNPSYLSRAFSEDTGASFTETLTGLRMEEALHLLRTTDLRGYEIAERVGIPDPKYFGACFKKYTGRTLQEARRDR